jgi:hypothetical protein
LSVAPSGTVNAERRAGPWQLLAVGTEPALPRAGPVEAIPRGWQARAAGP